MKKFMTICLLSFIFVSCHHNANPEIHYINEKFVIVDKGGYAERNGKFTNVGKYFLIKRLKDTTEFTELSGYNYQLTDSVYYNRNIGDTLYFKFIDKTRFWKKK